jgi:cell shape-determining protein MreC
MTREQLYAENEQLKKQKQEILELCREAEAALDILGGKKKIRKGEFTPTAVLGYRPISKAIKIVQS